MKWLRIILSVARDPFIKEALKTAYFDQVGEAMYGDRRPRYTDTPNLASTTYEVLKTVVKYFNDQDKSLIEIKLMTEGMSGAGAKSILAGERPASVTDRIVWAKLHLRDQAGRDSIQADPLHSPSKIFIDAIAPAQIAATAPKEEKSEK